MNRRDCYSLDIIIKLIKIFSFFSFISLGISEIKIPIHNFDGIEYISVNEYIEITNSTSIIYEQKKKIEFKFNQYLHIILSQNSSFIAVDGNIYHLYLPIKYSNNDYLVPIHPFLNIINSINSPLAFIDTSGHFLMMYANKPNIEDVEIITKSNGTIIKINTASKFNSNYISGAITQGGWLSLTIPGGVVDSTKLVGSNKISPIQRIRCLQYDESCQISFLVKNKIDEFEISSHDNYININLRIDTEENTKKIKEERERWLLDTIIIDPGHGGKDPGAVGIGGIQEKTITLDVAKKLGKLLEQNLDVNVVYTRENNGEFIPLKKRTKIANDSNGKLFISIHANSSKSHRASGFETYFLRPGKWDDATETVQRENDVIQFEEETHHYKDFSNDEKILSNMIVAEYVKQSESLAAEIQVQLDNVLNIKNRGVKQAGFYVLTELDMPHVLIELGFLSNKKDARLLNKSRYRQKMAEAIFRAIVKFKENEESRLQN